MYCIDVKLSTHPLFCIALVIYISSVYSMFSDRVGLPLHNIPSSGVLMKSTGAEVLRPDALPDVTKKTSYTYLNVIAWSSYFCFSLLSF